jgi:hypothetical protein
MPEPMKPVSSVAGTIFESICHLRVIRRRGLKTTWNNSTAALYRGQYLVTAAHNVHSNLASSVKRIRVSCGTAAFDEDSVAAEVGRDAVWVAPDYSFTRRLPERHRTDYAVIKLPAPIAAGKTFRLEPLVQPAPFAVRVAGYPGDDDGQTPEDGEHLYEGRGTAMTIDDFLLNYDVDTLTGVSGAPVWIETNAGPTIIAIHVGGTEQYARALVISTDVHRRIMETIAAFAD